MQTDFRNTVLHIIANSTKAFHYEKYLKYAKILKLSENL